MIVIKSREDIEGMRRAGRVTARICRELAGCVIPGVTTADLNDHAGELIERNGGRSAFKGYRGYPGQICISINEEVVHGIPGPRRVQVGDIVSLDVGIVVDGFVGDMATTVMVGVTDAEVMRLVAVTEQALWAGIERVRPRTRVSDISHAIEDVVKRAGFSVVRDFVGHGIGRQMHEDPQVPNFGPPGRGPKLKPGMTLAIEPMVNLGGPDVEVLGDGWTVVTKDRKPSAHFEHTIAVSETGAEILTREREERDN